MRPARRSRRTITAAALLSMALALPVGAQALASPAGADAPPAGPVSEEGTPRGYEVPHITSAAQRTALAATGVTIDAVGDHSVTVTADRATAQALRDHGYTLHPADEPGITSTPAQYTSYEAVLAAVDSVVTAYPELASSEVIGSSYEGRDITAVKLSTGGDEAKPEVLFTHNMHAREHLTAEMALYTLTEFTSSYGSDPEITELLDTRDLWLIPVVNPDGKVYDMESGQFRMWRKNREPAQGATGTDINRNFAYQWGCCGGSSNSPSAETYRGPSAGSAPETQVVKEFVRGRIVDGEQRITAHIDFHTYSELILWPYGFTYDDTAPGLDQDDRDAFATVGQQMAASNGYTPQQSSDLYITDGSVNDWMWGDQGIFSYTFEMYPTSALGGGFYPPGSVIDRETSRNREAMVILLENADCMYRSIGKEAEYCAT